jgi:cell cycle protein kinase DBF2
LGYVAARKERRTAFDKDTADRHLNALERAKEFKSYCGRERVILRKRRTKLKVNQFHIIAQVGQGGYGEVYLARKQDSGEVCALKKMRKRTLFKMDEVSTCWRGVYAAVVTLENRSATSWLSEIS